MYATLALRGQGSGIPPARRCILVAGLHRSGTSAITRVINLLGADLARDLVPTRPDNERGYWESSAVVAIHDALLNAFGSAPNDALDPLPLRVGWAASPAAREAKRRLAGLIEREFASSRLFVVKDPRVARLLPLWIGLLDELAIAPVVVIPFRNPLEVAASLARRDPVPLAKALLLYLHTYLELELASRGCERLFVRYDHVLEDWRAFAAQLHRRCGNCLLPVTERSAADIEAFLTYSLYHHRFSREQLRDDTRVPPAIVEMFAAMCDAARRHDDAALRPVFDRMRGAVAETATFYDELVRVERISARVQAARIRQSYELSTCWRITSPLRWMKLLLTRARPAAEAPLARSGVAEAASRGRGFPDESPEE